MIRTGILPVVVGCVVVVAFLGVNDEAVTADRCADGGRVLSTCSAGPAVLECAVRRATVVVRLVAIVASVVTEVETVTADLSADRGRGACAVDASEALLNDAVDATIEGIVSGVVALVPAEVEAITAYLFANSERVEVEAGTARS